jgi:hypothetical protein
MEPNSEAKIRDYLATNLDLIEPGLSLIEKERFLRNDKGANGFVDIFARSAAGHLVVIEIKRSDAAARQCIHELSKYAALLRQNLLVKNTEFKLLVLSTDWHELRTPFSEFLQITRYNCSGFQIIVGSDGLPRAMSPQTSPSRSDQGVYRGVTSFGSSAKKTPPFALFQ